MPDKVFENELMKHHRELTTDSGVVMLDTIIPEVTRWFWPGYIPLGKIALIDGDPGKNKTTMVHDLIARCTRNLPMPDGSSGIDGGAVLLSLEDGLADTTVPRLMAAGADLSRIAAIQTVAGEDGNPRFPTVHDLEEIKYACEKVQAKILMVDPLMAHLNSEVNSFRDQDVRRALTPLAQLADELDLAVILIRHLNKGGSSQSIYRGGGSIGIVGAARAAFLVALDPEDNTRRIFAPIKNNLAAMPPALSFTVEPFNNSLRIVWGPVSLQTADSLLAVPSSPEERSAHDEAKELLLDILSHGPVPARDVLKQARAAGINEKTLRRAKKSLCVQAVKMEFSGGWKWYLNEDGHEDAQDGHIYNRVRLGESCPPSEVELALIEGEI